MSEAMNAGQAQTCPQCDNHCSSDALQCGRGRKYFGVTDIGHDHDHHHGHGCGHHKDGLAGLLHQCGRFVRHAELGEDDLFRILSGEEKAALQALLEKLAEDWRERCGGESFTRCGHGHHEHKDGKHREHEVHSK